MSGLTVAFAEPVPALGYGERWSCARLACSVPWQWEVVKDCRRTHGIFGVRDFGGVLAFFEPRWKWSGSWRSEDRAWNVQGCLKILTKRSRKVGPSGGYLPERYIVSVCVLHVVGCVIHFVILHFSSAQAAPGESLSEPLPFPFPCNVS